MHRDLKAEVTKPASSNLRAQQKRFDLCRYEYNHERPHEALDMLRPAEIYQILKPAIVGGRLFAEFEKVKNVPGAPLGLPGWVIDCVTEEADQYLQNPEAIFGEE